VMTGMTPWWLPAPYDGPEYVGDEQDEPELVDEEWDEGPGR
jgi:hypothetical protein